MASIDLVRRRPMARVLALACVAVSAAALVACSGGGGKASTSATSQATATPTVPPLPTVVGSAFTFPGHGYAATVPDGWHANPNSLVAGPQEVDTFFSNDTTDGVQSNVSVTCEQNPTNVSTDQFVQNRLATLGKLGAANLQTLPPLTVSGVPAQEVSYTLVRGDITVSKLDVMLTASKCAWTLALSTAPSAEAPNTQIFQSFLQSFRLHASGLPVTPTP